MAAPPAWLDIGHAPPRFHELSSSTSCRRGSVTSRNGRKRARPASCWENSLLEWQRCLPSTEPQGGAAPTTAPQAGSIGSNQKLKSLLVWLSSAKRRQNEPRSGRPGNGTPVRASSASQRNGPLELTCRRAGPVD